MRHRPPKKKTPATFVQPNETHDVVKCNHLDSPSGSPLLVLSQHLNHQNLKRVGVKRFIFLGLVIGLLMGIGLMVLQGPQVPPGEIVQELLKTLDPNGQLQSNPFARLTNLAEFVPAMPSFATNYTLFAEEVKPGHTLAAMGYSAKHPVVMIPGFITTGLELWSGDECAMKYFRQRMWGTFAMVQSMLLDPVCWMDHMALDPVTGLDRKGRKLRPAQGFEAADYFVPGYWVWGKLIENLALLGYDNNNMILMSYDWRLSPANLERRDMYFTRLKHNIEFLVHRWQTKACIVAHSMGANVFLYFMKWVESPKGGNGGPNWVATYIDSFANLAGPMLGIPTSLSSLLSGEMKDTANLGPLEPYLMRDIFGPHRRMQLFRTWYSILWLTPKGGDGVWGNSQTAPDDAAPGASAETIPKVSDVPPPSQVTTGVGQCCHQSLGCAIRFMDGSHPNLTVDGVLEVLRRNTSKAYSDNLRRWFSFGAARDPSAPEYDEPKYWTNPLETTLPNAPNLTIYCLYGVGLETERAYYYAVDPKGSAENPRFMIDKDYDDAPALNGVISGPGDGSVPLTSLGYMCVKGWKDARYNPHGVKVKTREFMHQKVGFIPQARGGAYSGHHVDIMGNVDLLTDIMTLAAGYGGELEDRIVSDIINISTRVVLPNEAR